MAEPINVHVKFDGWTRKAAIASLREMIYYLEHDAKNYESMSPGYMGFFPPEHRSYSPIAEMESSVDSLTARAVRAEGDDRLEPIKYRVLGIPSRIQHGDEMGMHIEIEQRVQRDGSKLWAVVDNGVVLNRSGEWEYEPIPSSRTDAFIARTRFKSVREAMDTLTPRPATP